MNYEKTPSYIRDTMMTGIVYTQNDGRLAIESNEGKLLFPDRDWFDIVPGICMITRIKDKGTYGFGIGYMTRSFMPEESETVDKLVAECQALLPNDLFMKQRIESDQYGTIYVITHGMSEVLYVVYNSVDDKDRTEHVLSIGRRIDFSHFPFAPDGDVFHFGKFGSYFRKFKPFIVEDTEAVFDNDKNTMMIRPGYINRPFVVDKIMCPDLRPGACRITAINDRSYVVAVNYNYHKPDYDYMIDQLTIQPITTKSKLRLSQGIGYIYREHDVYGVILSVLDDSGDFVISSAYGVVQTIDHTYPRRINNAAMKSIRLKESEVKDIQYLNIDDDAHEWKMGDSLSRALLEFDKIITVDYVLVDPNVKDYELAPTNQLLSRAVNEGILSLKRINDVVFVMIKWSKIMSLSKFTNDEIIDLADAISTINREANDAFAKMIRRGKLKVSI